LHEALREKEYISVNIKAYKDVEFDNTGTFLKKQGFDYAFSVHDYLTEEEKKSGTNWGVEDKVFYKYIPVMIKDIKKKHSGKPILLILHTVMNHSPFSQHLPGQPYVYPEARSKYQHMANSIHAADDQLTVFMDSVAKSEISDNSIIIITGDHSFPSGDHGIIGNEIGFYEESFKTPFLILAPGHIKPTRIKSLRYSQLDVAPTILDLLNLREISNNFLGQSMLRQGSVQDALYMHQPYNGTMLIANRYPYKYLYSLSYGFEAVFNLEEDPDENNPLSVESLNPEIVKEFRRDIFRMQNHQHLLEQNLLDRK
jgi:phosphoglycerol transferase MdoB-like AlkP superfamily enzyme